MIGQQATRWLCKSTPICNRYLQLWQVSQPEACSLPKPGAPVQEIAHCQGELKGSCHTGAAFQLLVSLLMPFKDAICLCQLLLGLKARQKGGQACFNPGDLQCDKTDHQQLRPYDTCDSLGHASPFPASTLYDTCNAQIVLLAN